MGLGISPSKFKDVGRKVQFAKKDEADTLRNYLNRHIVTINMLLIQQDLKPLDVASEQTDRNQEELRDRLECSSRGLREVRGNMEAKALAVREDSLINTEALLDGQWRNCGSHKVSNSDGGKSMVSRLGKEQRPAGVPPDAMSSGSQANVQSSVSTQQIYTIMVELRASLPGIDNRFTYFQAPVRVEDVLGRVSSFSLECIIEALKAEIKTRFKKGPDKTVVMAGDFEIFNAKNTNLAYS